MTAGQLFVCVCCKEPAPEIEARYDKDYDGPVCQMCAINGSKAEAWLKVHRMSPATQRQHNRIK